MENNLYDFETEPEKRPSFLTWLCILTFIGSGWAIVSSIWSYTTAKETSAMFSQVNREKSDSLHRSDTAGIADRQRHSFFEGKIKASFSKITQEGNIKKSEIGKFISALFTLLGALLMWNLNRKGFYLYIVGVLIGILVPFYIFGNDLIAVGASSFTSFFGIVFIALYALNLKSMRSGTIKNIQ
jgi:hypothetical protein